MPPTFAASAVRPATVLTEAPVAVLLVEDNADDARLVRTVLAGGAFQLTWTDTLRDAVQAIRERHFDAILLDLFLPDSKGLDTFRAVRRAEHDAAVVVMTSYDDQEIAITAVGEGAQDFVLKGSLTAAQLGQGLRYAVARQRLLASLRASKHEAEQRSAQLAEQREELRAALDELGRALERESEMARRRDELDQLRRDLLSILAHDLRNPINLIYGVVGVLEVRWTSMSEAEKKRYLDMIQRNAENLERLIADVVEAARLQEGSLRFDSEPFDLYCTLASVVDHIGVTTGGQRVVLDAPDDRPPKAFGDEHRQWQVASNLIGNALKFAPAGSPVVVSLRTADGFHEVRVTDHGGGISPDEVTTLFQKFSRLRRHEPDGSSPIPGSGLGLFIARSIVEAQGGTIGVESVPGERTSFYYTVPVAGGAPTQEAGSSPA